MDLEHYRHIHHRPLHLFIEDVNVELKRRGIPGDFIHKPRKGGGMSWHELIDLHRMQFGMTPEQSALEIMPFAEAQTDRRYIDERAEIDFLASCVVTPAEWRRMKGSRKA